MQFISVQKAAFLLICGQRYPVLKIERAVLAFSIAHNNSAEYL
ncbi:hypothetical protein [Alishewanella tabrizica]|nr:hypothetical protein [Alishewanella tabrizica]